MNIYRHVELYADVASWGRNARPIGILKTRKVRLINLVEEVLARNRQFYAIMPHDVQIHSARKVEQSVRWGSGLCS